MGWVRKKTCCTKQSKKYFSYDIDVIYHNQSQVEMKDNVQLAEEEEKRKEEERRKKEE